MLFNAKVVRQTLPQGERVVYMSCPSTLQSEKDIRRPKERQLCTDADRGGGRNSNNLGDHYRGTSGEGKVTAQS